MEGLWGEMEWDHAIRELLDTSRHSSWDGKGLCCWIKSHVDICLDVEGWRRLLLSACIANSLFTPKSRFHSYFVLGLSAWQKEGAVSIASQLNSGNKPRSSRSSMLGPQTDLENGTWSRVTPSLMANLFERW